MPEYYKVVRKLRDRFVSPGIGLGSSLKLYYEPDKRTAPSQELSDLGYKVFLFSNKEDAISFAVEYFGKDLIKYLQIWTVDVEKATTVQDLEVPYNPNDTKEVHLASLGKPLFVPKRRNALYPKGTLVADAVILRNLTLKGGANIKRAYKEIRSKAEGRRK
jgi:hypothetical protein